MATERLSAKDIQSCFTSVAFPASKDELMEHAKKNCTEKVMNFMNKLPEKKQYGNMPDLTREVQSLIDVDINL